MASLEKRFLLISIFASWVSFGVLFFFFFLHSICYLLFNLGCHIFFFYTAIYLLLTLEKPMCIISF